MGVIPLPERKPVPQPRPVDAPGTEPPFDDGVPFWRIAVLWIKESIITDILSMKEGKKKMEELKPVLVNMIVRWILKLASGFLLSVGLTAATLEASLVPLVGAAVTFLGGVVMSLIEHKKTLNTEPPAK